VCGVFGCVWCVFVCEVCVWFVVCMWCVCVYVRGVYGVSVCEVYVCVYVCVCVCPTAERRLLTVTFAVRCRNVT
jgi:hypothetical protein